MLYDACFIVSDLALDLIDLFSEDQWSSQRYMFIFLIIIDLLYNIIDHFSRRIHTRKIVKKLWNYFLFNLGLEINPFDLLTTSYFVNLSSCFHLSFNSNWSGGLLSSDCVTFKWLCYFQVIVLLSSDYVTFKWLCYFQVIVLLSSVCTFKWLCYFQVIVLLSSDCVNFKWLCYFQVIMLLSSDFVDQVIYSYFQVIVLLDQAVVLFDQAIVLLDQVIILLDLVGVLLDHVIYVIVILN